MQSLIKRLIVGGIGVFAAAQPSWCLAALAPSEIANEKVITFTANSGDSVEAYAGHLLVPENRNAKKSRKIRINYVRFPATGNNSGAPIVYLAGGPGGSGIGTAKWRRFPLFMAMREFGDVIALDQRGTGASEKAAECQSDVINPTNKLVSDAEIQQRYRQAIKQCFAQWQQQGVDIYGYTTVQNAWDINDLRQHLGAEQVSLWGISYGSHLALSAMKQFPEAIHKVIIASVEGLDQTVKLPAETDAYFAKVQRVIEQQPLKQQVPDLAALMHRVHAKLAKSPQKVSVPQQDGSRVEILFQKQHMQGLASMMIADPSQYLAMLIQLYLALDKGDTTVLTEVLKRGMFNPQPIKVNLMSRAMDIASGISEQRLALVEKQAETSLLGLALNFPMPQLNQLDAKLDLGEEFRQDPITSIPTLVLSGTLDGRTYPSEQAEATKGLENKVQVTIEHAGHNLFMSSPKVTELMAAFMAGKKLTDHSIELPLPQLGR